MVTTWCDNAFAYDYYTGMAKEMCIEHGVDPTRQNMELLAEQFCTQSGDFDGDVHAAARAIEYDHGANLAAYVERLRVLKP